MPSTPPSFLIGIAAYEGVDLLDLAGPREMFSWFQQSVASTLAVKIAVVAETLEPITSRDGQRLLPDQTFADTPALDLLWIPGAGLDALKAQLVNPAYTRFIRSRSRKATYVASVCEGALLAANAGLLDGCRATTHWAFIACLKRFKSVKVVRGFPRYVVNRRRFPSGRPRYIVTGGGISSGLDEALELIRLISGKAVALEVQTSTQYYPKPPVNGRIKPSKDCPLDSSS